MFKHKAGFKKNNNNNTQTKQQATTEEKHAHSESLTLLRSFPYRESPWMGEPQI